MIRRIRGTSSTGPTYGLSYHFSLELVRFYLLHLSLMKEYLDFELHEIQPMLPFDYNTERVIDNFIFLVFLGERFSAQSSRSPYP